MARTLRVEQRRPGESEDRRAVEEGDAGDLRVCAKTKLVFQGDMLP